MKFSLIITLSFAIVVVLAVGAMWFPAAKVASASLLEARENQLLGVSKQVTDQAVGYFMAATKATIIVKELFEASLRISPHQGTRYFIKNYATAVFHALKPYPSVASCWVSQKRDPQYTNTDCNLDVGLISRVYVADVNNETTGNYSDCPFGQLRECDSKARLNKIAGASNITHPLTLGIRLAAIPCKFWMLASTNVLWNNLQVTANPATADSHGVDGIVWGRGYPATVGSPPTQAVYHGVFASTDTGPPWAPKSAMVQCGVRLSKTPISVAGEKDLIDILSAAVALVDIDTTLFILTPKKKILATSDFNFIPEVKRNDGFMLGLKRYDNYTVRPEITEVSQWVVDRHCQFADVIGPGLLPCNFSYIPQLKTIGSYTVAFKVLDDPLAKGSLGMLLVTMVKTDEVREPIMELNMLLGVIAGCTLVVCCAAAFGFGINFSTPISSFRDRLYLATELNDLQEISENPARSFVTEIDEMHTALSVLAGALLAYKSFLPASFDAKQDDEAADDEASTLNTLGQIASSQGGGDTTSVRSSGRTSKYSVSSRDMTTGKESKKDCKTRVMQKTKCSLDTKNATALFINCKDFHANVGKNNGAYVEEAGQFISMIVSTLGRGSIERFNGDRVFCAWNVSINCARHREAAVPSAIGIKFLYIRTFSSYQVFNKPLSMGIASGPVFCGIIGSAAMRSFNIVGKPVALSAKLCDLATQCSHAASGTIFSDDRNSTSVKSLHIINVVGVYSFLQPLCGKASSVVSEIVDMVSNEEWMYQVDDKWESVIQSYLQDIDSPVDSLTKTKFPDATRSADLASVAADKDVFKAYFTFDPTTFPANQAKTV